jgi:hypothetical protein
MSNARRLALSGAALIGLLALVAVATRAHRPGGGSGGAPAHPPHLLVEYLVIAMMVVFPFGVAFIVWALAQRRREAALEGRTSWRRTLVSLAILFALLLAARIAVGGNHVRLFHFGGSSSGSPSSHQTTTGAGKNQHASKTPNGNNWLTYYVFGSILFGFVFLVVAVAFSRRHHGEEWEAEAELAVALDEVLADTLADLRDEGDPRKAVIRTYARMEQTFAAYGVARRRSETPQEYLTRVLDRLRVSADSAERLTRLFERAKFSTHRIDPGMKDEAIAALTGLRAELAHEPERAAA